MQGPTKKSKANKPPFYHRIAFRFALILAVTMLVFDHLSGFIQGAVYKAFGLPDAFFIEDAGGPQSDEAKTKVPTVIPGLEMMDGIPGPLGTISEPFPIGDLLAMGFDMEGEGKRAAHLLTQNATREGPGRYIPPADAIKAVTDWLGEMGLEFVWFDVQGKPLATSQSTLFPPGESFNSDSKPMHMRWWPIETTQKQKNRMGATENVSGWIALWPTSAGGTTNKLSPPASPAVRSVPLEGSLPSHAPGSIDHKSMGAGTGPVVIPKYQEGRILSRLQWVAKVTVWVTILAVAMALSGFLSWLVTSRIGRLSSAVTALGDHVDTDSMDPGQDPTLQRLIRGRDEVGRLALSFSNSRTRILNLLASLAQRDKSRREWVAHASHDIRTPLTALSACLARIQSLVAGEDSATQQQLAGLISSARSDCLRLHELSDDLLNLARMEANDTFQPEHLLAGELTHRVHQTLLPLAEEKGVKLELDLGQGNSKALVFEGQGRSMLRVLENLVRNGIQHARHSVLVKVQRCETHLEQVAGCGAEEPQDMVRHDGPALDLTANMSSPYLLFEVLDDGPGFTAHTLDGAGKDRIGLRVVRRFLELHGGTLETGNWSEGGRAAFALPALELED